MPVTGVINSFLTVFHGLLTGEISSLLLEICSKVHDYRVVEPRIKHTITTIIILPSIHVAKLPSKFHDYLLCSRPCSEKLFLRWKMVNADL